MIGSSATWCARLLAVLLLYKLTGCQAPDWHVSVTEFKSPSEISFCFSKRPNCSGGGALSLAMFIETVDENGEVLELVWAIRPDIDRPVIQNLTYGEVPRGWLEVEPAKAMMVERWYRIESDRAPYFISFRGEPGNYQYRLLSIDEFHDASDKNSLEDW